MYRGAALAWVVWDYGDIEGDEMCEDFGGLRGVDGGDLAGGVDGLFDGGVLAVQVGERDIPMAE